MKKGIVPSGYGMLPAEWDEVYIWIPRHCLWEDRRSQWLCHLLIPFGRNTLCNGFRHWAYSVILFNSWCYTLLHLSFCVLKVGCYFTPTMLAHSTCHSFHFNWVSDPLHFPVLLLTHFFQLALESSLRLCGLRATGHHGQCRLSNWDM